MPAKSPTLRILVIAIPIVFLALHIFVKFKTVSKPTVTPESQISEVLGSFEGKSMDDQNINLADLAKQHKLIVINFWEPWCGPCQTELPSLEKIYGKYKNKGLEIFAVYKDSSKESALEMVTKNSLTFPIVFDENKSISKKFEVSDIPTTIVADQDLNLLRTHKGVDLELEKFIASRMKPGKK